MGSQVSSRPPQIVIVEEREPGESFLQFNCRRAGCDVEVAASAAAFVHLLDTWLPDLIVLDWTGPAKARTDLLPLLQRDELLRQIPILHFGAAAGADNRPHDVHVSADVCGQHLVDQIEEVMLAQDARATDMLVAGSLQVNLRRGRVSVNNHDLNFGITEVRLLAMMMRNPGVVLNRSQLLDRVWGRASDVEARTVDVHVSRIRKRLRPHGLHYLIRTARGMGYCFDPDG